VLRTPVLVSESRFLLLQVSGIRKENTQKIERCGRCVNGPFEALIDEAWKVTGVIYMRVRENNRIDGTRVHGRRFPIPQAKILEPLEKATINEDALPCRFEQELRSGHRLRRTQDRQLHAVRILSDKTSQEAACLLLYWDETMNGHSLKGDLTCFDDRF
jgi:hypothetical protein